MRWYLTEYSRTMGIATELALPGDVRLSDAANITRYVLENRLDE